MSDPTDALDALPLPFVFRPRDLEAHDIRRSRLETWLRQGLIERIERGLYRRVDAEPDENETASMVAARVPEAIICLVTALHMHGIGTELPRRVWIALDRKARKPQISRLPVHVVWFSGPMLTYGVDTVEMNGVPVKITSPERTIADCFRYRNKVGIDVAVEALRDAMAWNRINMAKIRRAAEVCRVRNVMRPYLEAMVA